MFTTCVLMLCKYIFLKLRGDKGNKFMEETQMLRGVADWAFVASILAFLIAVTLRHAATASPNAQVVTITMAVISYLIGVSVMDILAASGNPMYGCLSRIMKVPLWPIMYCMGSCTKLRDAFNNGIGAPGL